MSEDESPRSDPHSSVPAALLPWQKKPRFSWTPAFETTFFQSLCQSVQLGLRENMSFKPEAWNRALAVLREQGAYPTKPHLINKTDNARKKFRLWRGLVENPQFSYDQTTRTITGSDEAWAAHLEKEPLARAFRERPFENAEYLEVLFPDVVGSGGQPKRVTRPRRKGPDTLPGGEVAPGTSIMRLQNGPGAGAGAAAVRLGSNAGVVPPNVNSTPVPIPTSTPQSRQQAGGAAAPPNAGVQIRPAPQGAPTAGPGPTPSSSIQPPPPPGTIRQSVSGAAGRAANAASASALTPPEETNSTVGQGQKRFASTSETAATTTSKRRRTESSINTANNSSGAGASRNRSESQASGVAGANATGGAGAGGAAAAAAGLSSTALLAGGGGGGPVPASRVSFSSDSIISPGTGRQTGVGGGAANNTLSLATSRVDGIAGLLSDVLSKYASAAATASTTRWPEQAMEIFFDEFGDEDMDLQLRIAEKILTDTSKAVMFCKMPAMLRKHWVKRLREAISRQGN